MELRINSKAIQDQVNTELTNLLYCCNDDVFKFCVEHNWDIYYFIDKAYE